MPNYVILKKQGLIVQCLENKITLPGLKKFVYSILYDPSYNSSYKQILDLRKTYINLSISEISGLVSWMKEKSILPVSPIAIISSSPNQVAKSTIFVSMIQTSTSSYKIFSTPDAALDWLGFSGSSSEMIFYAMYKLDASNTKAKNK